RAALCALNAAAQASAALAFDRAAKLYRLSLSLYAEREDAWNVRVELADALASAGRGTEAAQAYGAAATGAPSAQAIELRRRAAEQFLRAGDIDEGIAMLRHVLLAVGMKLSATPRGALVRFLLGRARLRLRGTRFRERETAQIDQETLLRLDVCWSA